VSALHSLRRHPFDVAAHFDFSLVLGYALPAPALEPLLPPGLELDQVGDLGFLAVALVQTRDLRPAGWPRALGQDFFLAGYRVFARLSSRPSIRGLRILRSDADSRVMKWSGNLFTHYSYQLCRVHVDRSGNRLKVAVDGAASLQVEADLRPAENLPSGSPFRDLKEARRFAGPLPNTFGWEPETRSLVIVGSVRTNWEPVPVSIETHRVDFLDRFSDFHPRLANAFYVQDVDYRWKRGVLEAVA
jgi:hypothetical protein